MLQVFASWRGSLPRLTDSTQLPRRLTHRFYCRTRIGRPRRQLFSRTESTYGGCATHAGRQARAQGTIGDGMQRCERPQAPLMNHGPEAESAPALRLQHDRLPRMHAVHHAATSG